MLPMWSMRNVAAAFVDDVREMDLLSRSDLIVGQRFVDLVISASIPHDGAD
jgi:hypothetical protein